MHYFSSCTSTYINVYINKHQRTSIYINKDDDDDYDDDNDDDDDVNNNDVDDDEDEHIGDLETSVAGAHGI